MWLERFVIVVTSLTRDFVPSSWGMYYPTVWDWSTYAGTIGVFLALMFLFIRGLPAISIFEMREVVHHETRRRSMRMLTATSAGQLERLYGLMAEFDEPELCSIAARAARTAGYREMDAYSPMPVEGLAEAIGFRRTMVAAAGVGRGTLRARPADSRCAGG